MARWVRDDAYTSPTLVKAADSRKAIELILAIYESAQTGRLIRLAGPGRLTFARGERREASGRVGEAGPPRPYMTHDP